MLKFELMFCIPLILTSPLVPRSLKYLLSDPTIKTFADPWPRAKKIINKREAEFEAENLT
jgi:hypothetical protein